MFVFPITLFKAAGGATATTWNPSDKSSTVTLSNGNLTAASASVTFDLARSTTSKSSGKWYFEFTVVDNGSSSSNQAGVSMGIVNGGHVLTSEQGHVDTTIDGIDMRFATDWQGWIIFNNGLLSSAAPHITTGGQGGIATDFGASRIWFRNNSASTVWNDGGSADPATGVGGYDFSSASGPFFAAVSVGSGGQITGNFGGTSFGQTPPSGFTAWG